MIVYIDNDNVITVDKLRNILEAPGQYINNAQVEVTIKDLQGTEVAGQAWPLTLGYIASSNGKYQGILEDGLKLNEGDYRVRVRINAGSDKIATLEPIVPVQRRT